MYITIKLRNVCHYYLNLELSICIYVHYRRLIILKASQNYTRDRKIRLKIDSSLKTHICGNA